MKEQQFIKDQQDHEILVTNLPNFKKTAIYNDEVCEKLRNGDNSMIAIFMYMFA